MLKNIDKSQLRNGMFVEDLQCSWEDNPFASRRFLLETQAQVDKLKASSIAGVIINTALGIDTSPGSHSIEDAQKVATKRTAGKPRIPSPQERQQIVLQVLSQSEEVVEGLFQDVRKGGTINAELAAPVVRDISRAMERDPLVFLSISRLKSKDETTFRHSIGVSALMVQFGRYIKLEEDEVQLLGMSGLLHDVAKMKIPGDVLTKDGKLTENELQLIRNHPALGHAILSSHGGTPEMVLDVCLHHHERLDGKGYPDGLSGDEISLPVRICTICDVYEAITSVRPYKKAWTQSDAIAWMLDRQGHFDRALLREFVASLEMINRNSALA